MIYLRLLLLAAVTLVELSTAFVLPMRMQCMTTLASSVTDDFANFAASLEEDDRKTEISDSVGSFESASSSAAEKPPTAKNKSWQEDLDELLNPMTPVARKQILLSDLAGANSDIQASIQSALRDGKIDPLLTPRGKRLQEGTRAVARQVVNDILPSLAKTSFPPPSGSQGPFPPPPFPFPPAEEVNRLGTRVLNALQNQIQTGIKNLQEDLQDPTKRIPQRLSQQTEEILQEAGNVFSETPAGLKEPPYTVVATTEAYEIRDYEGYKVAITNMITEADDPYFTPSTSNLGEQGRAFNSLAAYLFGANRQKEVMDMTTPVTTTMSGEMRFYIDCINPPDPLEQDESKNVYETDTIRIAEIPPARLAVRRFYGFVTQGEVARQKEALLTALALDGDYELDVPHGQTVGHLIFQYNPPYTIPVVRRNEIAVPINRVTEVELNSEESADRISENWISPSDGETEN